MQLVLSNNRVIAYGENCFLAMGGTVVCPETGKTYDNATLVTECSANVPCDIDKVGYEYRAGVFVPCAPFGMDNNGGYIMVACKECATPKNSGIDIATILRARITVTAPEGSTVTATQGETVLTAKEKNGVFVFYPTDFGEWTISVPNDELILDRIVNVDAVKLYTVIMARFMATITVTYPAGAGCTCSDGVTTFTAPDTSGECVFTVYNAGTWTVTATDGGELASASFEISVNGESQNTALAFVPVVYTTAKEGISYSNDLEAISWDKMSKIAKEMPDDVTAATQTVYVDDGANHYQINIGDTKTFISEDKTLTAQIIGMKHDTVTDVDKYGKEKAGFTFQVQTIVLKGGVTSNSQQIWENSSCRMITLPDIFLYLESALRNIIVAVNKSTTSELVLNNPTLKTISDTLFLLSATEATGRTSSCGAIEGMQYKYYRDGNSLIKYFEEAACYWYTRSICLYSSASSLTKANVITDAGAYYADYSNGEHGIAFAFCI